MCAHEHTHTHSAQEGLCQVRRHCFKPFSQELTPLILIFNPIVWNFHCESTVVKSSDCAKLLGFKSSHFTTVIK